MTALAVKDGTDAPPMSTLQTHKQVAMETTTAVVEEREEDGGREEEGGGYNYCIVGKFLGGNKFHGWMGHQLMFCGLIFEDWCVPPTVAVIDDKILRV